MVDVHSKDECVCVMHGCMNTVTGGGATLQKVSNCERMSTGDTGRHNNTPQHAGAYLCLFKCSFLLDLAFLPDLCMYEYVLGEVSMSNCIALSNTPIRSPWDWKTGGLSLMSWTKTVTGR